MAQSSKNKWDWVSSVRQDSQVTSKYLEKVFCLDKMCHVKHKSRSCPNNPRCLTGFGGNNTLGDSADQSSASANGDESSRGACFVGLKNLGATCYVNSLLQVLYHNLTFRRAIFEFQPSNEIHLLSTSEDGDKPNSPIGHLQLIFAKMHFCKDIELVDPSDFVKALNLDEAEQQDASEFSNLLMCHLENRFMSQNNSLIRNVISDEFYGVVTNIIRCNRCSNEVHRQERFCMLHLNIKEMKTLHESLQQYFKPKQLEGDNKYACHYCDSNQEAVHKTAIISLPKILTLQLLRFEFDLKSGVRTKIRSSCGLIEMLDMTAYLKEGVNLDKNRTKFFLRAVVIHKGKAAHSGHYVVHIKDKISGFWYEYSDETITKKEKHLKLDDSDASEWTNDNNAYVLVYESLLHAEEEKTICDKLTLPAHLMKFIEEENKRNEEMTRTKVELKNLCASLPTKSFEELYELISTKWLSDFLRSAPSSSIIPINNNDVLCQHGNVDFNKIPEFKCISAVGADHLYKKYGGGPRLTSESLCRSCVSKQVTMDHLKKKLTEDDAFINAQIKNEETMLWVSKDSLKQWKKMVLKSFESAGDAFDFSRKISEDDQFLSSVGFKICRFNDEILCEHGQLNLNQSSRTLISQGAWKVLTKYFPEATEIKSDQLECGDCIINEKTLDLIKARHTEIALRQKKELANLFKRQNLSSGDLEVGKSYFVLNRDFYVEWKKFLKDPTEFEELPSIKNTNLLCAHEDFLYQVEAIEASSQNSRFVIVTDEEWTLLIDAFSFDHPIQLLMNVSDDSLCVVSIPPHCMSCDAGLLLQQKHDRLNYQNQPIYVKLNKKTREEINETNENAKRQKLDPEISLPMTRTSTRKRLGKDMTKIEVSSTDTLKSLRWEISKHFQVSPFGLLFIINDSRFGEEALDSKLCDLEVYPETTIIVEAVAVEEADAGSYDASYDGDYFKGSTGEGFKVATI